MKAENLRNPKISLHVPIAAPKLELWALNITGRIYLIAAVYGAKDEKCTFPGLNHLIRGLSISTAS